NLEAPMTGAARLLARVAIFVIGSTAVDFGETRFGFGVVGGIILVHHVDVGIARQVFGDPAHNLARVLEQTGHDEMPDQHTAQGKAVNVYLEFANLCVHRRNNGTRGFGVVAGDEIFSAMLGIPKFEIGHVDVDDAVHPANAFEAVVGRGVVNDRQT